MGIQCGTDSRTSVWGEQEAHRLRKKLEVLAQSTEKHTEEEVDTDVEWAPVGGDKIYNQGRKGQKGRELPDPSLDGSISRDVYYRIRRQAKLLYQLGSADTRLERRNENDRQENLTRWKIRKKKF